MVALPFQLRRTGEAKSVGVGGRFGAVRAMEEEKQEREYFNFANQSVLIPAERVQVLNYKCLTHASHA